MQMEYHQFDKHLIVISKLVCLNFNLILTWLCNIKIYTGYAVLFLVI